MQSVGASELTARTTAGEKAGGRRRWVRVKVLTDDGVYVGRLRLEEKRGALHDLIADARAYLGVFDATREGSETELEFVALHKGTIRAVVVLGGARSAAAA